tara:strand:- start:224 stop:433 length:210 start_codon:yes stop_codon:yes gene_type:complete
MKSINENKEKTKYLVYKLLLKLGMKKGNFFEHLDIKIIEWLAMEASNSKTDIGVIVACIIEDAYHEEHE